MGQALARWQQVPRVCGTSSPSTPRSPPETSTSTTAARSPGPDRGPVSSFATLVRVVILVVPLIFKLFSLADQLPSALYDHVGIVHVVQFGGRLVNRPAGWILNVRTFVRVGHRATPSTILRWIRSFLTLRIISLPLEQLAADPRRAPRRACCQSMCLSASRSKWAAKAASRAERSVANRLSLTTSASASITLPCRLWHRSDIGLSPSSVVAVASSARVHTCGNFPEQSHPTNGTLTCHGERLLGVFLS